VLIGRYVETKPLQHNTTVERSSAPTPCRRQPKEHETCMAERCRGSSISRPEFIHQSLGELLTYGCTKAAYFHCKPITAKRRDLISQCGGGSLAGRVLYISHRDRDVTERKHVTLAPLTRHARPRDRLPLVLICSTDRDCRLYKHRRSAVVSPPSNTQNIQVVPAALNAPS
jgi:hypothetical protein